MSSASNGGEGRSTPSVPFDVEEFKVRLSNIGDYDSAWCAAMDALAEVERMRGIQGGDELEELKAALYRAGDLLFGTWDDDAERAAAMRRCEREIRTLIGEHRDDSGL